VTSCNLFVKPVIWQRHDAEYTMAQSLQINPAEQRSKEWQCPIAPRFQNLRPTYTHCGIALHYDTRLQANGIRKFISLIHHRTASQTRRCSETARTNAFSSAMIKISRKQVNEVRAVQKVVNLLPSSLQVTHVQNKDDLSSPHLVNPYFQR
jgi:hypothetical protein